MILNGRAFKYGDDINTDLIIPARYLNTSDPKELAKHCMEDEDPDFPKKVKEGDFIVAGKNFGCGSSREHAPISIKASGVSAVIAKSFARIFYRNAFNMGLLILECNEADEIKTGDELLVDTDKGEILNKTQGKTYKIMPVPEFMVELLKAGGLIEFMKKRSTNK
ncbi:MAG: 3-isopropylmalate dehydratase small subunit [Proteobacteria bacterium]|nr:3-isopropylmalate dehydratase small subunit [Pseudomonadota bacterium]